MTQQFSNVQPVWKFCLLYIVSLGLYQIPWSHKHWKFIKERENLNISAWFRAWFFSFTLYSFCKKVFALAEEKGYREKPSPGGVTVVYWVFIVLGRLPDPLWLITFFSFVPLLTPLKAINYYWEQEQPNLPKRESFTGGEIAWLVCGGIVWLLVLIGIFIPESQK